MGTLGQIQDDAEIVAIPTAGARFMPLAAAGAALGCSPAQAYSLICHGDLPAIRLAGCGEWRVERAILEQYLRVASGLTRERATTRPLGYPPAAQRPACVIGFGGRLR